MQVRPAGAGLGVLLALASAELHAQAPITLPGDKVFPENIASDKAGNLYVGNLVTGGVFRIQRNSTVVENWIAPGTYGSNGVLGVLADERSNTLWICSNSPKAFGVEAVAGGDLPTTPSFCNDTAIGPDGSAFVTNSSSAEILRLPPNGKTLEVWFSDPSLQPKGGTGLDGLAFGPDLPCATQVREPPC